METESNLITDFFVEQVANGWKITERFHNHGIPSPDRTWVFCNIDGMTTWLNENLKEPQKS